MNQQWNKICSTDDLVSNSGVCALIEGRQVAIFQLDQIDNNKIVATSNWDPIGQANVMYRGLLGSTKGTDYIASPLYKQRYNLDNGACIDDPLQSLKIHQVKVEQHEVFVKLAR
ncbi:nitrite reductase small subunit NirD [Aliiglaciecola sp. LCG003]|uniref:nitrite reductase small subunit NirD n=1 Tax=Aliiglaciecola sp. LCG003 TaxID=3053655 RepID=UPI002572F267|nr:nitrite reductase small subunit NirD [Aliiglaciecola sp. LCG003]WJG11100.1 nitrite reductase small subunit NirD [Aliiglaciecola sp. LCG003]